jgi:cell division protein FtsQ
VKLSRTIKKILFISAWVIIGSGITVLLVAANSRKQKHVCKDLAVTIKGVGENFYIDKHDIIGGLRYEAGGKLIGRPVEEIDLSKLERQLEKSSWIRDAELYFDSRNVLHVIVFEREPIARVFTTAGRSFYIDSSGTRLPLLDKVSVRVPVITNFTNARKLSSADSLVLNDMKHLATFVNGHEFWSAQVAQIDIIGARSYEIIPTVGNHMIRIGDADNLEQKFSRLMVYYKQVVPKVGLEKYAALDARFDGLVIGIHKGQTSKVDSIQLQKNIKELMERSQLQSEANQPMELTTEKAGTVTPVVALPPASVKQAPNPNPVKATPKTDPVPLKTTQSKPVKAVGEKSPGKKPKAVMPKKASAAP